MWPILGTLLSLAIALVAVFFWFVRRPAKIIPELRDVVEPCAAFFDDVRHSGGLVPGEERDALYRRLSAIHERIIDDELRHGCFMLMSALASSLTFSKSDDEAGNRKAISRQGYAAGMAAERASLTLNRMAKLGRRAL